MLGATYSDVSVVWLVGPWVVVGVFLLLWVIQIKAHRNAVNNSRPVLDLLKEYCDGGFARVMDRSPSDVLSGIIAKLWQAQADAREERAGHEEARRLLNEARERVDHLEHHLRVEEDHAEHWEREAKKLTPKRDKLGHFAPKKKK